MLSKVKSFGIVGLKGFLVDVEVDIALGIQKFDIVGLPDNAVKESRDRVCSAIKNSMFVYPTKKITVNLAPANTKKEGPAFDLAIALGILGASGQLKGVAYNEYVYLGELSLDGSIRAINGVLPILISAKQKGYNKFIIPTDNAKEASYIEGIEAYAISNLEELVMFLKGDHVLFPVEHESWKSTQDEYSEDFCRVRGQAAAKRAMEIAVAGGHNILMVGPPGSGKTLLARCVPSILPDLTFDEALEVTKIHSVSGILNQSKGVVTTRPFRAPHHTASVVALTGGGKNSKPGEISLAHNGVLFLDEMPEYQRSALETLRQPLEDGVITVSRIAQTVEYPANFILVASMNPCPCGNYGSRELECTCSPSQIHNYMRKISGPLMDRIDIKIDVDRVKFLDIHSNTEEEPSSSVKKRVDAARKIQQTRFANTKVHCNAKMNTVQVKKYCNLDKTGEEFLKNAFEKYKMSARGYSRILKVSRTIADLDGSEDIKPEHVAEAIAYRNIDKNI